MISHWQIVDAILKPAAHRQTLKVELSVGELLVPCTVEKKCFSSVLALH